MNETKLDIENIGNRTRKLDFSDTFNLAFELYKKIAVNAGIIFLILGILFGVAIFGVVISLIGMPDFAEKMQNFNPINLSATNLIIYLALAVIGTAASHTINAGLAKMAHLAKRNEQFSIGTAFDYFNSPYLIDIFIASTLIFSINFIQMALFTYLNLNWIGTVLSVIVAILCSAQFIACYNHRHPLR